MPDRHYVKEALKEHGCKPPKQQTRRHGVKVRLWTHYRAASAASPSARGHEAPQSAATAKGPGDLSHASPPFRERSEVQKTGGHQQSLPGCAEKGEAARQKPEPLWDLGSTLTRTSPSPRQSRRSTSNARFEAQSCVLANVTGTQDSPSIVVRPSNGNDWDPTYLNEI